MPEHEHPPQKTVPQTPDVAPASPQTDTSESIPSKSPHWCPHEGIPDPYTYSWDSFALDEDPLEFVIAKAAAQRVLFPLETARAYFSSKAFEIAEANILADKYGELSSLHSRGDCE